MQVVAKEVVGKFDENETEFFKFPQPASHGLINASESWIFEKENKKYFVAFQVRKHI